MFYAPQLLKLTHKVDATALAVYAWLHDKRRLLVVSLRIVPATKLLPESRQLLRQQERLREEVVLFWVMSLHDCEIISHSVFVGQHLYARPLTDALMRLQLFDYFSVNCEVKPHNIKLFQFYVCKQARS
jgi:hypothetical protein